jgi:hypothetical protein
MSTIGVEEFVMEQHDIIRPGLAEEIGRLSGSFVLAVDLGFSKARKTCGLAWRNGRSGQTETYKSGFGECANKVSGLLKPHHSVALIVEAPLSGRFDKGGNPIGRGSFERPAPEITRYWYSGPGAAMCLAATFFLRELVRGLGEKSGKTLPHEVVLYEGFITFKSGATDHLADARELIESFFCTPCPVIPVEAAPDNFVLPILDIIGPARAGSAAPAIIVPRNRGA